MNTQIKSYICKWDSKHRDIGRQRSAMLKIFIFTWCARLLFHDIMPKMHGQSEWLFNLNKTTTQLVSRKFASFSIWKCWNEATLKLCWTSKYLVRNHIECCRQFNRNVITFGLTANQLHITLLARIILFTLKSKHVTLVPHAFTFWLKMETWRQKWNYQLKVNILQREFWIHNTFVINELVEHRTEIPSRNQCGLNNVRQSYAQKTTDRNFAKRNRQA